MSYSLPCKQIFSNPRITVKFYIADIYWTQFRTFQKNIKFCTILQNFQTHNFSKKKVKFCKILQKFRKFRCGDRTALRPSARRGRSPRRTRKSAFIQNEPLPSFPMSISSHSISASSLHVYRALLFCVRSLVRFTLSPALSVSFTLLKCSQLRSPLCQTLEAEFRNKCTLVLKFQITFSRYSDRITYHLSFTCK